MHGEIRRLVLDIKELTKKIRLLEIAGGIEPAWEIGPYSFVQILASIPLIPGQETPVSWQYNQCWVNSLTPSQQQQLIGAYLGERIGQCKIIGIFEAVKRERY